MLRLWKVKMVVSSRVHCQEMGNLECSIHFSRIPWLVLSIWFVHIGDWPNSLDCTDLKNSVEPAVMLNCVASVTNKQTIWFMDSIEERTVLINNCYFFVKLWWLVLPPLGHGQFGVFSPFLQNSLTRSIFFSFQNSPGDRGFLTSVS